MPTARRARERMLMQNSRLEVHVDVLRLVVVPGGGVGDLRGGEVELRLAQLHDGCEAEVISALGKVHGKFRLLEQLLRKRHAVIGGCGVQVCKDRKSTR